LLRSKKSQQEPVFLGPLATTKSARIAEFRLRKQQFVEKRCTDAEEARKLREIEEWREKRKLQDGSTIFEKKKPHDIIFENRLWCILYQMGFTGLSIRGFKIGINSGNEQIKRQVGVFASFEDIIVVAECKSSARAQNRDLTKDLVEIDNYRRGIGNSLRKHYNNDKLKIIWMVATNNINLSSTDLAKAKEKKINIITNKEIRYFEEIAKNIGPASRYQFLSEFLSDQKIPALANYSVPALRLKLGGNLAYYFLAPVARILPIAFVNHRALQDIHGLTAYQRVITRSRLKEIDSYLQNGGYFPNNILINFKEEVRFDKQSTLEDRQISAGQLYLPDKFKSAWIIDGQHRLYGYTENEDALRTGVLPFLAFEKLPAKAEAELFTTINSKQRKVAPSLLDELAGELRIESDDINERIHAIASRTVSFLGSEGGGPFEGRVRTADLDDSDTGFLTISSIKSAIVSARLVGEVSRTGAFTPGPFSRLDGVGTTHALSEGLSTFFGIVREANPNRWNSGRTGYLCANIAVQGYIRLLAALIEHTRKASSHDFGEFEAEEVVDLIKPYIKPVLTFVTSSEKEDFERRFKQRLGSGGPPRYYFELCRLVQTAFPDFHPDDFVNLQIEKNSTEMERATKLTISIVERIHNHVVKVLKQTYGIDYFDKGIPQKEIKVRAMEKKYDDASGSPMPPENYLDVVDLKRIIEHNSNWDLFKSSLGIRMPSEQKGQAKFVKWLDKLNEIRRIPAHPYGRNYSDADIELIEFIDQELSERNI
jgi:DNA sulfur modification protein DndB